MLNIHNIFIYIYIYARVKRWYMVSRHSSLDENLTYVVTVVTVTHIFVILL